MRAWQAAVQATLTGITQPAGLVPFLLHAACASNGAGPLHAKRQLQAKRYVAQGGLLDASPG